MYWQTQDILIFFPKVVLQTPFAFIILFGTPYNTSTRYIPGYLTEVHSEMTKFQPFCYRNGFQPQRLSLNLIYQMRSLRVQNLSHRQYTASVLPPSAQGLQSLPGNCQFGRTNWWNGRVLPTTLP